MTLKRVKTFELLDNYIEGTGSSLIEAAKKTITMESFGNPKYVAIDYRTIGSTMPANSTIVVDFYARGGMLLEQKSETLAAAASTHGYELITSDYIGRAEYIVVTFNSKQTTSAYTVSAVVTILDEKSTNYISSQGDLAGATVTGGAAATAAAVNAKIQLTDILGADITNTALVYVWLSSDASGETPAAVATSVAIGTDGSIIETHTAKQSFTIMSEDDGDIDIDVTHNAATTFYLNVAIPGREPVVGTALTWS